MKCIYVISLLLFCNSLSAQSFKCIENGKTILTDKPCRVSKAPNESVEVEKTAAQIQKEFEQEKEKRKADEAQKLIDIKRVEEEKESKERLRKAAVAAGPRRAEIGAISLRAGMRDPDSFKLVVAKVANSTGTVCFVYRSKNGFGGYVSGLAILLAYNDNLILSATRGFTDLWQNECDRQEGTDYAAAIRLLSL
jgi:hypothetical protein